MNYNKKTVKDVDVRGKKVLLRCDFNVPLDKETGAITSDKRIVASLPTIQYLLDNGARVVACSHLGKPKGAVKPELSLAPVAKRLSELLGKPVAFTPADVAGEESRKLADKLGDGEIMLLENLRFDPGEEKNDPAFAKKLASFGEIFVSDAFGTVHRAHASTEGVSHDLPGYAGFLIEKELSVMGGALDEPKRPFVAVLGGAKVSDKIGVISNLIEKADTIIVGGGMAYTFLKAQGKTVGSSLVEDDQVDTAKSILAAAAKAGVEIVLPVDHVCADKFDAAAVPKHVDGADVPDGLMGLDVGPKTLAKYRAVIGTAKSVVWNGPVGVFEFEAFAKGTGEVARLVAEATDRGAVTVVGGGDSVSAVNKFGLADRMSHVSTGGGASLELLEGKKLPGIEVCR